MNTTFAPLPVSTRLVGKVAVVTGASKGIGAAIARHLGAAGAAVVYLASEESSCITGETHYIAGGLH